MSIEVDLSKDPTGIERYSETHPSLSSRSFNDCNPDDHPTALAAAQETAVTFRELHKANIELEDALTHLKMFHPSQLGNTPAAYAQFESLKSQFRKNHDAKLQEAADRADRCCKTLETQQATLRTAIENKFKTPQNPAAIALAGEIRAHVRALPSEKARFDFVRNACERGDVASVGALIDKQVPHYLTGATPEEQQTLRTHAEEALCKREHVQERAIANALEAVRNNQISFLERLMQGREYSRPVDSSKLPQPKKFDFKPAWK